MNKGKIPLTDAELIKALFLNYKNFPDETNGRSRLELAMKWDRIESILQGNEFWIFLRGKNDLRPSRIEYLFDLIEINDEFNLKLNDKDKEKKTFNYFERVFNKIATQPDRGDVFKLWDKIEEYFNIIEEWFIDYKFYHYIGYLTQFYDDVKVEEKDIVATLIEEWKKSDKKEFQVGLKKKIRTLLQNKLKDQLDLDYFEYEIKVAKRTCRPILLLYNIETVIQQNDKLVNEDRYKLPNFTRFPFHLYKLEKWEIEHIRPNSDDDIGTKEKDTFFLEASKHYVGDELRTEIEKYLIGSHSKKTYIPLYKKICYALAPLADNEKNFIWNYTLLDKPTNGEYHNDYFPLKRYYICQKEQGRKWHIDPSKCDSSSSFVPPCTKAVFTKAYTAKVSNMAFWSKGDAECYLADMKAKLSFYLT